MNKLKLRWKILFALIGLSVTPMLVTLVLISGLTDDLIQRDMSQLAEKTGNFAERSTASSQRENANYIDLLCSNTDVVNATYYATLTQDVDQLSELIVKARARYDFDLLEVRGTDGGRLLRIGRQGLSLDETAEVDQAPANGEASSAIGAFAGRLSIIVTSPIMLQNQSIGTMIGVTLLDDAFASRLKTLSGTEVAFFNESGIVASSLAGLKDLDPAKAVDLQTAEVDGKSYALYSKPLGNDGQGVILALDRQAEQETRASIRGVLFTLAGIVAILALVVGLTFSRGLVRPLTAVVDNLKEIADGEGDLTRTLAVTSQDEVGDLAMTFNRFILRLREMVQRIRVVTADVNGATEKIRVSSGEVAKGAASQASALEESFAAIQGIDATATAVAGKVGSLLEAAEESSAATLELGASTSEIAEQMERLFATVDEVSSSINEMSVTSQQITENVGILSSSTEVTASSIIEMDSSIKEIEENAERTNLLSEAAAKDAERGKEAVDQTIEGIEAIRTMVDRAGTAIQELGKQSHSIGKILTVIDEVADQTGLLSLNAAIIAAQAGEHGKGFAVVASEIRNLADRTAISTREISTIIDNLQKGTREAVAAMQAGSERVHQEASRSKETVGALDQIRTSTLNATHQVRSIVRATQEQARGSKQITNSINQIASMLGQISTAVRQQTDGTRQLAKAAEAMKEIASHVKLSTGEQTKGSKHIAENMQRIQQMVEAIDSATGEQTRRNRQVIEAVSQIRHIAEANSGRAVELDQVVDALSLQAAELTREMGAFKA